VAKSPVTIIYFANWAERIHQEQFLLELDRIGVDNDL